MKFPNMFSNCSQSTVVVICPQKDKEQYPNANLQAARNGSQLDCFRAEADYLRWQSLPVVAKLPISHQAEPPKLSDSAFFGVSETGP